MRPPPSGHMVINMKTTITTHGAHNGMIVQAGVQSGPTSLQNSQWYVPSRFPQLETTSGANGLQAVIPGVSQENLTTSWPTLRIATNSPQPDRRGSQQGSSPLPPRSSFSPEQKVLRHERSPMPSRIPSSPPSPVFSFNGRDSPPDEFIQPTKVTLNVFNPGRSDPIRYQTSLRRSNPANADALINDTVTTTTTVEVFRVPLDPTNPERLVALPPPPVPSIDDRPQLLRVNGPDYEKWSGHRTETLINDRPVQTEVQPGKAVQWKKTLVDEQKGAKKVTVYDPYSGPRSPYKNAATSPHPSVPHQFQLTTVNSFDERLLPRRDANASAYLVQSPTEFSQVSHPFIPSSQEDVSRSPYRGSPMLPRVPALVTDNHELVCHPAIPDTSKDYRNQHETPILSQPMHSGYEQVRRPVEAFSPCPKERSPDSIHLSSTHYVHTNHTRSNKVTTLPPDRHRPRRPHSSYRRRRDRDDERYRHRSESPTQHRLRSDIDTSYNYSRKPDGFVSTGYGGDRPDPNILPGAEPLRAKSQEIFNLYQTRDIMQNVVAQFKTVGYSYCDDPILSPLAESDYSVISEVSTRADRTRSDILEANHDDDSSEGYLRPLHRTNRGTMSNDLYGELEHIYEELDNYQSKTIDTPEESLTSSTVKEDDSNEESAYAMIDFMESISETSEVVSKQDDDDESDDNDVASRLRREITTSSPHTPIRIRKAHPDGLVFPKITAIVSTLPEVPEEFELLPQAPNGEGIALTYIPYADESPRHADEQVLPEDLTTTKDDSKIAVIKTSAEVKADQHRLVISGWEKLISDSDDGS